MKLSIEQVLSLMKEGSIDVKEGLQALEDVSRRLSIIAEQSKEMVKSAKVLIEKAESISKKIGREKGER